MAYASLNDFQSRLGTERYLALYPTPDTAETDLDAAAAELDGSLAYRYRLPVTGARTLALVSDWNLTLAEERAAVRSAGGTVDGTLRDRVEAVRHYLTLIRTGEFVLPDGTEKNDPPGGIALARCDRPVFGRERSAGF
ncbi:MAG: DUF1320 family protein [Lentisphaeria bacterium]|nr:DUF1320 family protein [Lentisphaeria bacterium]